MNTEAVAAVRPPLLRAALQEWLRALRMWRLWTALGMEDLSDRYRRTLLGISWVATSFAVFVGVKVLVFGQMANVSRSEFILFVTIGFGVWSFINSMVLDCCVAYVASANWLMGTSIPYPVFFLQSIFRNCLVFGLILLVMLAALVWQKQVWTPTMLAAIPGLLVYVLAPMWLAALLAPLCARFRDMNHAMQTVMRLLFFVTPIIWVPTGRLAVIADHNVFTHFIEIVRQPLIHDVVPWRSWGIVAVVNAVGLVAGFISYAATRHRIAYWL